MLDIDVNEAKCGRDVNESSLAREFIAESLMRLARSEACLLKLETDRCDLMALDAIYWAFRMIRKGGSIFLKNAIITDLAYCGETFADRMRSRFFYFDAECAGMIRESIDILRVLIIGSLNGNIDVPESYDGLIKNFINIKFRTTINEENIKRSV